MVVVNEERDMDMALLEKCQEGESEAFPELVERYRNPVFNLLYRFLNNEDLAGDVLRETFVRASNGVRNFPEDTQVHAWLFGIAGNLVRNVSPGDAQEGNTEKLETFDGESDLQEAIVQIPEQARLVFVLKTFGRLNYEEIAEVVRCPRTTVKSRMNQARTQLRDRLKTHSVTCG